MRVFPSRVKTRRANGEQAVGIAIFNNSPDNVEAAGTAGADFVFLDAEHGSLGISELANLIRAADAFGIDAIVRVPNDEPSFIMRLLDAGAAGIVIPHIKTAAQLEGVIRATRYGPEGFRGACPNIRALGHMNVEWITEFPRLNDNVQVWAIIEDLISVEEGLRIVETPGLSSISFGMVDLRQSLGLKPGEASAELDELVNAVYARAAELHVDITAVTDPSIYSGPPSDAPLVIVHSDRAALVSSFQNEVAKLRVTNV